MALKKIFNRAALFRRLKQGAIVMASLGVIAMMPFKIKGYFMQAAKQAWATQRPDNLRPANNDPVFDTFRHAYTSARLTQCFGAATAQLMMDGNEALDPNPIPERRKDTYNNDCAAWAWGGDSFSGFQKVDTGLAQEIRAAMYAGLLKTNPVAVPPAYKHSSYFSFIGF